MFHHSRNVSSAMRRTTLLSISNTSRYVAVNRCSAKGFADERSRPLPPMSQKLSDQHVPAPTPAPSGGRRGGRKILYGAGMALSAAAAGGALFFFDPLGLFTETKKLAPAPHLVKKNAEGTKRNSQHPHAMTPQTGAEVKDRVEQHPRPQELVPLASPIAIPAKNGISYSSINMIAQDTVEMLVSGKRTPEETKMIDEHQKRVEQSRQMRLKEAAEKEKAQRDAVEAENELRKIYQETKEKKNEELTRSLSRHISEALEQLQAAANLNRLVGDLHIERAQLLRKALDASDEREAQEYWPRIDELREKVMHHIGDAMTSTTVLQNKLKELFAAIAVAREDVMTSSNTALNSYEEQAMQIVQELDDSLHHRDSSNATGDVMKHRYNVVQEEMEMLEKELETLPNFKPGKSGERFSEEELRELVKFAHQKVYQLKTELVELECMRDVRLKEVLGEQRVKSDNDYKERLQEELANQRVQYKKTLEAELRTLAEQDAIKIRDELTRQGLAKANHAADMLKLQEEQLYAQYKTKMEETIASEKAALTESLVNSFDKLNRLESHAREKADVVKVVTNVQKLMSSARYLQLALTPPGKAQEEEYKLIDISDAVTHCRESVPDDTFVQTILNSLPVQALTSGIYSLTSLEERFSGVFAECKKTALFPNPGNMFYSSLSRVYGRLLMFTVKPRYDTVADFYEHGIEGMDTKDLLIQAQHFMGRGHLAEAVKCMVQLKGLPRQLAQDWINEALLRLEVHQASDAIMYYAQSRSFSQIL